MKELQKKAIKQLEQLAPEPVQPAPRNWVARATERKFLVPVLVLVAVGLGIVSHAIPWGWEAASLIAAVTVGYVVTEGKLDWSRIRIPEVPGVWDNMARAVLEIAKRIAGDAPGAADKDDDAPPDAPPDCNCAECRKERGLPPLEPTGPRPV